MEKKIDVIFEDENIVVINKPYGLVVNRSNTYKGETLQDILYKKYHSCFDGVGDEEFVNRSGMVHRLDKDTSGVIVAAKNVDSFHFLQKQFKDRKTYKKYVALVHGEIEDEIVEINAPISRSPKNPLKMAVVSGGKTALTRIEKIKTPNLGGHVYTLADVFPKTGRTHQIRVHFFAIQHPIAGDIIYCAQNLLKIDLKLFNRMMLHAEVLGFVSPSTGKFKRFISPLPKEFKI